MEDLEFLFKTIRPFSLNTLLKIAKKISKEKDKNKILIILDMTYCGIKYGTAFYDYLEFEFYNLNSKQRKTYLTRGINNNIIKRYNNKDFWYIFDNKSIFNDKFKKYINRDTINLKSASLDDFKRFVKNKTKIIAKPNCGEGGKGIKLIEINNNIEEIYNSLNNDDIYLIEEVISQHQDLNKLYDKSVNSIRMFTFNDGKNAYFLQAVLKLGNGGFVDNFSSGGMYCFADENGKIITPAIDRSDLIYEKHPISGESILGFEIPYFKEAIELVKNASFVVSEVKYIGWDVAITDKGPVLIEGNCYPGVFQIKPSLSKDKIGILPKYKKIIKIK